MVKSSFMSFSSNLAVGENMLAAHRSMELIYGKLSRYFDIATKEEIEYYHRHVNRNNQGHQVFKSDIMSFKFEVLEASEHDESELFGMLLEITNFPESIVLEKFQWYRTLPDYCEVVHNCQIIDKEKMVRRLGRQKGDLNFEKEQAPNTGNKQSEYDDQIDEIDNAIALIKDPDKALAITSSAILLTGTNLDELKKKSSMVQGLLNDNNIENRVVLNPAMFYVEHFKKRRIFSEHTCLVEMGYILASGLPVSTSVGD